MMQFDQCESDFSWIDDAEEYVEQYKGDDELDLSLLDEPICTEEVNKVNRISVEEEDLTQILGKRPRAHSLSLESLPMARNDVLDTERLETSFEEVNAALSGNEAVPLVDHLVFPTNFDEEKERYRASRRLSYTSTGSSPVESVASTVSKATSRINSWSRFEKAALIGIVSTLFLLGGTLSFQKIRKGAFSNVDASWRYILRVFNCVKNRAESLGDSSVFGEEYEYPRSAASLRRKLKCLKTESKSGLESFRSLFNEWRLKYNQNNRLLNTDELLTGFGYATTHANFMEDSRLSAESARFETLVCQTNASSIRKGKDWTELEEAVLVGSIMDRFLSSGSLVSSNESQCWTAIKHNFDARLSMIQNQAAGMSGRNASAIQRHFKVMRERLNKAGTIKQQTYLLDLYSDWITLSQRFNIH